VHRPSAVDVDAAVPGGRQRGDRLVERAVQGDAGIGLQRGAEDVHRLALVGPLGQRRDHLVGAATHDQRVDPGDELGEPEVAALAVVRRAAGPVPIGLAAAGQPGEVAVGTGDEPVDAHAEEHRTGEGRLHARRVPDGTDERSRPADVSAQDCRTSGLHKACDTSPRC
jgi:hypothetical protein